MDDILTVHIAERPEIYSVITFITMNNSLSAVVQSLTTNEIFSVIMESDGIKSTRAKKFIAHINNHCKICNEVVAKP